jgi:hypothetical protein
MLPTPELEIRFVPTPREIEWSRFIDRWTQSILSG